MSLKLRSSASKQCLLIIDASSQIITEALVVLPPGNNNEAIPLDATFSTISPLSRIAADRIFHKKVFLLTTLIIWSYTDLCSSVN
ncbi:hypothetical protein N665_0274s0001 [Sinapis alba]|nr:hypothetical protein N665_0274s0001 [Sinapis alba]